MFFGPIGKTRWPPWPLIGWDIFGFSSETAEWNSTKLDRKQDFNVLYQDCVFRRSEKQDGRPGQSAKKVAHCTQVHDMWPFGPLVSACGPKLKCTIVFMNFLWSVRCPSIDNYPHFHFSSETAERNLTKLCRKEILNILYQVCVFRADWKTKMVILWFAETFMTSSLQLLYRIQGTLTGSKNSLSSTQLKNQDGCCSLLHDWPRLLLFNRGTDFNETRQEAENQHPLPDLCFSGSSENKDGHPGFWLAERFLNFHSAKA